MVGVMSLAASAQSGAGWYNGRWYDHNPYIYSNGESGAGWYNGVWYDHNPYLNNSNYYQRYYNTYPTNDPNYNNNRDYYNRRTYYRNGYYYDDRGRRILNDLLNLIPR